MSRFCFICFFLSIALSLSAQSTQATYYQINSLKKAKIDRYKTKFIFKNNENGVAKVKIDKSSLSGIVKAYKIDKEFENNISKKSLERKYTKKNNSYSTDFHGNESETDIISPLNGMEVVFNKTKENWIAQDFYDYEEDQQTAINQDVPELSESDLFNFPDSMFIGQRIDLSLKDFLREGKNIKTGSGSATLISIKEEIATFKVDFDYTFIETQNDGQATFQIIGEGIIQRSLDYFYNRKNTFNAKLKVSNYFTVKEGQEGLLEMEIPGKLIAEEIHF